jgi:hypothetical protein
METARAREVALGGVGLNPGGKVNECFVPRLSPEFFELDQSSKDANMAHGSLT